MFLKASAMESAFFFDIKEGCKVSRVRIFLSADLLGSQHLLEVLQRTSLTFKNSEKVVKRGCFKKKLR